MAWYTYKRSKTLGELKAMAERSKAALIKRGEEIHPVVITGRAIAKKWWGKAWCDSLDRYADYENRLDRGKRYARAGTIVDMQIERGRIDAMVQGSKSAPYIASIEIDTISAARAKKILESCSSRASTLEALVNGDMPEEMKEVITAKGALFPSPKEIKFECSCPDWAHMCKHVAAALFAAGAVFDEEPMKFFELRGIDTSDLIMRAAVSKVELMLANADRPSPRILPDELTAKLFGISTSPRPQP